MIRLPSVRALLICLAVAPALLALPARPTGAASTALPSASQLSALLNSTGAIPRDLQAIGTRLKLHSTTPLSALLYATPRDLAVGSEDQFWVSKGNTNVLIRAQLALKTTHAYFYVQDGVKVDRQKLQDSANVFEQRLYPRDTAAFGTIAVPGPDNDSHVTILNARLGTSGTEGYVYEEDLLPRSIYPYSNQRKIMYIDLDYSSFGSVGYESVLAHEFQHVIHEHLHPSDDAWLNEGSSVLAQVLNGYAAGWDMQPELQLNSADPATGDSGVYGNGFRWLLYLYEQFGGDRFTRAMLADGGKSNMQLFDDLLPKIGVQETANQAFADWVVANFLNDRSIAGGKYGYQRLQTKAEPTTSLKPPFTYQGTMPQYAATYLDIPQPGDGNLALTFQGSPTVRLLNTTGAPSGGFWWSIRGDGVDDTLTTPVLDLTHVQHATLHYQVFYDLEQDYDYGYVEVSADGGKTWYAQHTPSTTSLNPNGTNMAEGYTGSSCPKGVLDQRCWHSEQVDLSPYAGKKILVRFEQVTDDEFNGQGVAIGHVQVPEIGYDGDAAHAGWQPSGWVHAANSLAEQWIVQALIYRPTGVTVSRLPVDVSGHGTLKVPAGATRVVVVVSPTAPYTTVPAPFTVSAS